MNLKLDTLLSGLSCLVTVTAVALITIPIIECYYFFIAGCLVQITLFTRQRNWPLLAQMSILLVFNLWGFYNWTIKGIG